MNIMDSTLVSTDVIGTMIVLTMVSRVATVSGSQNISCGEHAHLLVASDRARNITSPGYPAFYSNGLTCRWKVYTFEYDSVIILDVLHLDLENSSSCVNDHLTLYRGYHQDSIILSLCGNTTVSLEVGRIVTIEFITNNATQRHGFVLQYYLKRVDGHSGEHEGATYSRRWGLILAAIFGILLTILLILIISICQTTRKEGLRPKTTRTEEHQTYAPEVSVIYSIKCKADKCNAYTT